MKIYAIAITLFLSIAGSTYADVLMDKEAAKLLVSAVMEEVGKGNTENGLMMIKPYVTIPGHEFAGMIDSFRMQAPAMEQRFGKTFGTEFVGIEEVGNSLMQIVYIQKFERHVMRWLFYFYKPKDNWVLNTFHTDDKIQMLFNTNEL